MGTHTWGCRQRPAVARRDRGASLVEFALIAPLLFALFLGMITGGLSLSVRNSMTNSAREGARFGATLNESATWADSVVMRVRELAGNDLSSDQVCVKLFKKTSSGETVRQSNPCPAAVAAYEPSSASVPVDNCAVKVWAYRQTDLETIFFTRKLDLTAVSISRYERGCS